MKVPDIAPLIRATLALIRSNPDSSHNLQFVCWDFYRQTRSTLDKHVHCTNGDASLFGNRVIINRPKTTNRTLTEPVRVRRRPHTD